MLCGRRKGSILLLGTCWNQDLDGGDPLIDRSCLFNTARRALLAQSLLDIARGEPFHNLVKLCEISYHRPKEEIKGKVYPEQEEEDAAEDQSLQRIAVLELRGSDKLVALLLLILLLREALQLLALPLLFLLLLSPVAEEEELLRRSTRLLL